MAISVMRLSVLGGKTQKNLPEYLLLCGSSVNGTGYFYTKTVNNLSHSEDGKTQIQKIFSRH
jgi:hypothetical protein